MGFAGSMRRRGDGGDCVGGDGRGLRRRCGVGDVSMVWCYTAAARDEWTKDKLAWVKWVEVLGYLPLCPIAPPSRKPRIRA